MFGCLSSKENIFICERLQMLCDSITRHFQLLSRNDVWFLPRHHRRLNFPFHFYLYWTTICQKKMSIWLWSRQEPLLKIDFCYFRMHSSISSSFTMIFILRIFRVFSYFYHKIHSLLLINLESDDDDVCSHLMNEFESILLL